MQLWRLSGGRIAAYLQEPNGVAKKILQIFAHEKLPITTAFIPSGVSCRGL
jgi:hypothetical protein